MVDLHNTPKFPTQEKYSSIMIKKFTQFNQIQCLSNKVSKTYWLFIIPQKPHWFGLNVKLLVVHGILVLLTNSHLLNGYYSYVLCCLWYLWAQYLYMFLSEQFFICDKVSMIWADHCSVTKQATVAECHVFICIVLCCVFLSNLSPSMPSINIFKYV